MTNPDARNIFGMAATAIYCCSLSYSDDINNKMCQALARGFEMSNTDGDTIFSYFKNESNPSASIFTTEPYTTYTEEVKTILSDYISDITSQELDLLSITAHALIFGYCINPAINFTEFQGLLGTTLAEVSQAVLGKQFFRVEKKIFITPFSSYQVLNELLQNDYSTIITSLTSESKELEVPLTNYNWYDVSPVFAEPDLQIMKDIENQYYYISGEMIYQSVLGSIDPCIEDTSTINTWSGQVTSTYYRNTPCRENDTYIGPPNSVQFLRIFNDGPASSGYFTTGLSGFYIQNDKAMLSSGAYLSNTKNLKTEAGISLCNNVPVDVNGEYSLLNGDYLNAPYSYSCSGAYQRMHIGDEKPRFIYDAKTCTPQLKNVTGFKYVALSLPDDIFSSDWQFRQTNPLSENNRLLLRALNVEDNPYRATDEGGVLFPYILDTLPPYSKLWNVGYPILGQSTLPELAFFQKFENSTLNETASIAIYPSLASSNNAVGDFSESDRTYTIGSKSLFSGEGSLPLRFYKTVSSNLSGYDRTTQKFLGMGTAFSGQYSTVTTLEENAGFFYSGFNVLQNGQKVNNVTLADSFLESTIGKKYETIKTISGYRRKADGVVFGLSNIFAVDDTKKYYTYNYFGKSDVPMINLQQDSWSYFAPAPSELENAGIYEKIYEEQKLENYLPRFYDGPFSSEKRKFLYPNALAADKIYQGKVNGIPKRIHFKVKIREEALKEVYGKYTIYEDGSISDTPEIVSPIRSDILNGDVRNPVMDNMFIPNESYEQRVYDFNNWTGNIETTTNNLGSLVDINWAPSVVTGDDTFIVSGRNNDSYSSSLNPSYIYTNGVRVKTAGYQSHFYVETGNSGFYFSKHNKLAALYHASNICDLSGVLTYVEPIFNLTTNSINPSQDLVDSCPDTLNHIGTEYTSYDGKVSLVETGRDALFLEMVGGRRGSDIAEQEGGYHSKGVIGDRWLGLVRKSYGFVGYKDSPYTCYESDGHLNYITTRAPSRDEKVALFNADASGVDIWINGMSYSPFSVSRNTLPLDRNTPINFSYDKKVGILEVNQSGEFLTFDLGKYFPTKDRIRDSQIQEWYYSSGFRIGPFDRDVEIGLSDGEEVAAYTDFYINETKLSHHLIGATSCDRLTLQGCLIAPTIKAGSYYRNNGYTILSVIPSGTLGNFNIYSDTTSLDEHSIDKSIGLIGLYKPVKLTLKTHVPCDENEYDSNLYSGEVGRLSPFDYVNNGIQKKYRINFTNLSEMNGVHSFTNDIQYGKLYFQPDTTEFKKLSSVDKDGNISYPSSENVETYWKSYAVKNEVKVNFSGYREASRISFEIYDLSLEYDRLPYQSLSVISPSGSCLLSGEMGYYAQADNTVFSQGIYLINTTENDDFAETYNPSYVSDVLKRVPTGYFIFPVTASGSGDSPVLKAPSVMKQREFISGISDGQKYSYLFKSPSLNYNKLKWPALSDLETLNAGETIESIPPADGETFTNNTLIFSASQGQSLANGLSNPIVDKKFSVVNIFQLYDSASTDAMVNKSFCIGSGRGTTVDMRQSVNLSGVLVPRGTPLGLIAQGLI